MFENTLRTKTSLVIGLALLLTAALSGKTRAQTPEFRIAPKAYVAGGLSAVSNPDDFKDRFSNKITLMLGLGLAVSPTIEIIAKVHFYNFDLKDSLKSQFVDPNITFTTIGADLKWKLLPGPSPAKPYLLLGGGNMTLDRDTAPNVSGSESNIYFNFGGGLDVSLGPQFSFFVEGKFVILNTEVDATGVAPILFGIRLL